MENEGKILAVVRIRGRPGVSEDIAETLDRLRLKRVNNCVILKPSPSYIGMVRKCSNYIAYGEVNEEILKALISKSRINSEPSSLIKEGLNKELREMLPIRLHPPRHGYKSIKRSFTQGGSTGYMGEEINNLLKRMI